MVVLHYNIFIIFGTSFGCAQTCRLIYLYIERECIGPPCTHQMRSYLGEIRIYQKVQCVIIGKRLVDWNFQVISWKVDVGVRKAPNHYKFVCLHYFNVYIAFYLALLLNYTTLLLLLFKFYFKYIFLLRFLKPNSYLPLGLQKLSKMDFKSIFLYRYIAKEVFLEQSLDLKIMFFQIICISWIKHCMVKNKLYMHCMKG